MKIKLLSLTVFLALSACASHAPTKTASNAPAHDLIKDTDNHEPISCQEISESPSFERPSTAIPMPITPSPMVLQAEGMTQLRSMGVVSTVATPRLDFVRPPVNTEKYQHTEQNPIKSVNNEPVSTFSIDVDTGSYSNVRRFLNDGGLPPADAVRTEEMINYFDYNYPKPTGSEPFAIHHRVFDSPWQPNAKLIKIGILAKEMTKNALPPANLVFLVDVSGSMQGDDKLGLVKQTLCQLTHSLRPIDTISIVTYASGEKLALPPTKGTKQNKEKILSTIKELQANGATAGEQAIRLAYEQANNAYIKNGINRILLMTDGDFNVGITDFNTLKDMVAQKRKSGVSLSTFGFGTGNYNEMLMEQLADAGDGNYSYIDDKSEIGKVLDRQLTSTLATVAKDVKIQVEFNPSTVKEYRLVGYENRMLNQEDFNNDKVDAGDIGAGHSMTAIYEIIPVGVAGWLSDSRYQNPAPKSSLGDEYANIAIRYKLPDQTNSHLITTPVPKDSVAFEQAGSDEQFVVAVATFADLLKGGKYSGNMTYQDVKNLAQNNIGKDKYGLRTQFVKLVDTAEKLSPKAPE